VIGDATPRAQIGCCRDTWSQNSVRGRITVSFFADGRPAEHIAQHPGFDETFEDR
jgi:hypothetical protein